ncbi:DUF3368 domain-containing protein [Sphingobacterium hungaricum]|uniref:DUF3368 domain-containing protein n=1 Tax=Sphingobacterium hungaricum TaxID=2082723 RepID=A0A928YRC4_9SPHI|nr:DUF3368 domain-containing protein [Sphingobacterium hungaricum]MBE8714507.1 DUF3368 domain-containing protein [Sphingobacterium hungaricum]
MPKVVSNTTPILSLLKISKLHLLHDLYEIITIPEAVFLEIEAGKHLKSYINLVELKWIEIKKINNLQSLDFFFDLDYGEAEVLVLAKELEADLVILDENLGRRYAQQLGLNVTGTLGVLLKAKQRNLIKSVRECLLELIENNVWISPAICDKVLQLANE